MVQLNMPTNNMMLHPLSGSVLRRRNAICTITNVRGRVLNKEVLKERVTRDKTAITQALLLSFWLFFPHKPGLYKLVATRRNSL